MDNKLLHKADAQNSSMFQDFSEPAQGASKAQNLIALRIEMKRRSVDVVLVPRADEFQGEYVAPASERLAWLTGFTGSAGLAAIGLTTAAVFVDGRYTLQAPDQIDTDAYQILQVPNAKLSDWISANFGNGSVVGFDPWLHTIDEIERLITALKPYGIRLKPLATNPVDKVWGKDRPGPPQAPVSVHPLKYAGVPASDKIDAIKQRLRDDHQDAAILTLPDSMCWAFNIRGRDIPHTPVVLAYAIIHRSRKAELFVAKQKLPPETREHLRPLAQIYPPEDIAKRVQALKDDGKRVRIDTSRSAFWFARKLGGTKRICPGSDPCSLPKARKNVTELAGIRKAHLRDGIALCRFLAWLDEAAANSTIDEIAAAQELEARRAETGRLIDLSFDTISGSGPNGAIVHYRVTTATNRKLRSGELYLVDSGAQYIDGTTDVTRTVAIGKPTAEMRRAFTAVLKGHIAIASARFPQGTRGVDLDPLARRDLWIAGLDYDHGTGHGVGAFLSVHEGPASISRRGMTPLEPGMILSNEPGYYKPGHFGIRIENLVLVTPLEDIFGGDRQMMGFEDLTRAPIDLRLIDAGALTRSQANWLDQYHARVYDEIAPHVNRKERDWLKKATAKLGK